MSFCFGRPPKTPLLEAHFFELLREVGGGFKKNDPPFFGLKIMNLLVFFDFEPKKCFWVPTPWGLCGAEWDERFCILCTFQPFLLCRRPVLPTLRGVSGDVVPLYAY